jgi:hypothetical protein
MKRSRTEANVRAASIAHLDFLISQYFVGPWKGKMTLGEYLLNHTIPLASERVRAHLHELSKPNETGVGDGKGTA